MVNFNPVDPGEVDPRASQSFFSPRMEEIRASLVALCWAKTGHGIEPQGMDAYVLLQMIRERLHDGYDSNQAMELVADQIAVAREGVIL